ncbi:surface lipoprotein assembly modifier [Sphingomonas sp.]|uniref:surface lipoprotein assembly modifier n=1 Tax=Sphingomonas sp. TaxID=28214 RepID=UPI0038A327D7
MGVAVQRREYGGTRFDETIGSGWSGPQWFGKNVEASVAATLLRRWYGGRLYQEAIGGRVEAVYYPDSRTAIPLSVAGQQFNYPTLPDQSGPVWSASAGVVRILDPTTSAALLVNGALQRARTRDLSNRSFVASLSVTRDLRGGFTFSVAPTYALADYEAPDALFGIVRHDRSTEFRIALLNRRVAIWRFTPSITYTHVRRKSTISLYDTRQDRLECGLTTLF